MSLGTRIANVFRSSQVDRDIDKELQSHFDEAQAEGRDPGEVSRAFGSRLRTHEAVRDVLIVPWLESLKADVIFGWRQLLKHKTASVAAILSLALGLGASMAAFRLIDALFLRPLTVAHPELLYALTYENLSNNGEISINDQFDYPAFPLMRVAVKDQSESMAIGFVIHINLTFGTDQDIERAWRQYVSGWTLGAFGLKPAVGRLFTESDDLTPGAHPYAVISYDYWSRRFGKDPKVIGRRFRAGNDVFEIIGVTPKGFTGTVPGTFTDIYLPSMMNAAALHGPNDAYQIWFIPKAGASLKQIAERLNAVLRPHREEQVKSWSPDHLKQERDFFLAAPVRLELVGTGRSGTQQRYRRPLTIFAILVALLLLIACANVANLMTAQAASRAREMALRVSIGAGRARLIQLVLLESGLVAIAASVLGLTFSWWAAPVIVAKLNFSDSSIRLALPVDGHITMFALVLIFAVTILFGIAPALGASSITPASALKGVDDPHSRRRLMNGLVAAQVAFCSFVLFAAGEFIATFERMANQPTGFSTTRLLTLESVSRTDQSTERWYEATQHLASLPGVESAALAQYALMSFHAVARPIWANGHSPDGTFINQTWSLAVSPGWFETMKVQLLDGRDFRWDDEYPKVAIVNEKFALRYFGNQSSLGRTFETISRPFQASPRVAMRIVGVVRDARYEDMRLPVSATAYMPLRALDEGAEKKYANATFVVRTRTPNPMTLASMLRREVSTTQPEFRVDNIVTQEELVRSQMIRERLLAILSLFFAIVALTLAAVGLYGVLNYAVLERRRELGIRIALGATSGDIASRVIVGALSMIALGSAIGIGLGLASERYIAALLYQVKATEPSMLALPLITMLGAAVMAAVPPVFRAVRIDPAALLRSQ